MSRHVARRGSSLTAISWLWTLKLIRRVAFDLKLDASCEVARKSRRSAASSSNELMEQAITLIRFLISLIHQNVGTEYCGSY